MEPLELITQAETHLQEILNENYGIKVDVCMLELLLATAKLLLAQSQNKEDNPNAVQD